MHSHMRSQCLHRHQVSFTLTCSCPRIVVLLQVYRGILRKGGQPVAVKVQRPGVRESIALDIYILRWLAGKLGCLVQLTAVSSSGKCQLLLLQLICMQCSVSIPAWVGFSGANHECDLWHGQVR